MTINAVKIEPIYVPQKDSQSALSPMIGTNAFLMRIQLRRIGSTAMKRINMIANQMYLLRILIDDLNDSKLFLDNMNSSPKKEKQKLLASIHQSKKKTANQVSYPRTTQPAECCTNIKYHT